MVLAFCMGTDTQNILNSPIGQPMATVSVARILETLFLLCFYDRNFFNRFYLILSVREER